MLFFFTTVFLTAGCSTVLETLNEPDSPNYYKTTDSTGQPVYQRRRVIDETVPSSYSSQPLFELIDLASALSSTSNSSMTLAQSNPGTVQYDIDSTDTEETESSRAITVSLFTQKQAFNADISYEMKADYFSLDLGLSAVSSDKSYIGFSTIARMNLPWTLTPYLGVGLYLGDSKTCQTRPLGYGYTEEICDKYFLSSLVGEIGLQYTFSHRLQTRLGARYFSNARQQDDLGKTLYGINIGVLF